MNVRPLRSGLVLALGIAAAPLALAAAGVLNPGQMLNWIAFLASIVAGLAFLAASGGREAALPTARAAYRIQWIAYVAAAVYLWHILFTHQFRYQYVASYSSRSMPGQYVYAAFWGGQEGTFMLWALLTCTLGLILLRVRHALTWTAMFFLNLPLVMLGLVTVMRGPFLEFAPGSIPLDGTGLNPLLQDPWMTIHPPVLFTGFSSLAVPFAIAMAALVKREYDGWIKLALPWAVLSTGVLSMGFIMGGVWAYKVLGWGGYWGWDPVENGSLIPWLSNVAMLHGLLIQRVSGSLRRTNFFLAVTSYVLVLYASFLTRSGVLADFSVHSFVNLGLNGFLLSFLICVGVLGYALVIWRLRDIPGPQRPLGNISRESMMWLGQLVLMLMCALTAVGMSAPLITRLFGPPSNVQTSYYNLVNAPLAVALGLLMGIAPLMRWREQDSRSLLRAALPAVMLASVAALAAAIAGVREPLPICVVFGAAFALTANLVVTVRGFRSGWKHGVAYLGHTGVSLLLIGVVASSNWGRAVQVQLPRGEERSALGYRLTYQGVRRERDGRDRVMIAVNAPEGRFRAMPRLYWSEFNQGYMKKPHIERFLTHDVYISPLEMVGADSRRSDAGENAVWFEKGESKKIGQVKYTFIDFDRQMGDVVRIAARMRAEIGGRTVTVRPVLEMNLQNGVPNRIPDYLPGGGSVVIATVDPNTHRVALVVPGMEQAREDGGGVLAVELSTKPLINLVWLGAILMLGSVFMSVARRAMDLRRA
ncbi:MAG: cytochrome c biogenesis protein CcsA [Candidatus Eisenbacteria bacterium]|nr:cytochrome c biogenesis protein CcsA [Candidatus Eisenbacteria bacterium]